MLLVEINFVTADIFQIILETCYRKQMSLPDIKRKVRPKNMFSRVSVSAYYFDVCNF